MTAVHGSCSLQKLTTASHLPPLNLTDEHSLVELPPRALRSQSSWELLVAALQAGAPGLAHAGCLLPQQASCRRHQQGLSLAMFAVR